MNRTRILVFCASVIFSAPLALNAGQKNEAPGDPILMKETIVGVLAAGEHCKCVDRMQSAIQPLLFALARHDDAETNRVLVELSTYRLGVANDEIYHCILSRRGRPVLHQLTSTSTKNDCGQRLGSKSSMCLTRDERKAVADSIRRAIETHARCDIEY